MVKRVQLKWRPNQSFIGAKGAVPGKRVLAFLQARTSSKRFPNKIYAEIGGKPMLYHCIDSAQRAERLHGVVIVSPEPLLRRPANVAAVVYSNGDENDVLARFAYALDILRCDYVLRLTADCPLLDHRLIDEVIYHGLFSKADYCSNVFKPAFPDGLDAELISAYCLRNLNEAVKDPHDREHVTSAIRSGRFKVPRIVSLENDKDFSGLKWSVDTKEDLEVVSVMVGTVTA